MTDSAIFTDWLSHECKVALAGLAEAGDWMVMSATERGSPRFKAMAAGGFVRIERRDGQEMWRITDKGRARISEGAAD